jgi:hypothetical protein
MSWGSEMAWLDSHTLDGDPIPEWDPFWPRDVLGELILPERPKPAAESPARQPEVIVAVFTPRARDKSR